MASDITSTPSLPEEARAIIWRIFGAGASPLTGRSTYALIEPIIRKRVHCHEQDRAIAEVRAHP